MGLLYIYGWLLRFLGVNFLDKELQKVYFDDSRYYYDKSSERP